MLARRFATRVETRAATSHGNVASQRVLLNAGFTEVGPADPSDIGGKEGAWYQRNIDHVSPGDALKTGVRHACTRALNLAGLPEIQVVAVSYCGRPVVR